MTKTYTNQLWAVRLDGSEQPIHLVAARDWKDAVQQQWDLIERHSVFAHSRETATMLVEVWQVRGHDPSGGQQPLVLHPECCFWLSRAITWAWGNPIADWGTEGKAVKMEQVLEAEKNLT